MKPTVALLALALSARWGLCAEPANTNLLQAPGFEGAGPQWKSQGQARYQVVTDEAHSGTHALRYRKQGPGDDPKENSHYDQNVVVEAGVYYVAGAWVKATGDLRPVLRLADANWQTLTAARAAASAEWQKLEVLFSLDNGGEVRFQLFGGAVTERRESAPGVSFVDDCYLRRASAEELAALRRATLTIKPQTPLRQVNPLFFGANALFTVEDDEALADPKLKALLKAMPCRLLRYPGGEMADNYHWQTHKLDNPKRWPSREGPPTTDTDEFMAWCQDIGAEPIFVVNLESGFVHQDVAAAAQEAAAWVQYCNDQGYRVKYWEIGNETYLKGTYYPLTARQYGEAFGRFARAMKAVDSTIKVGAVGPEGVNSVAAIERDKGGEPWWPTVVEIAGEQLDFAVIHHYHGINSLTSRVDVGQAAAELHQYFAGELPHGDVPIALTEWNTWRNSRLRGIKHALVIAEMIHSYLEGGVDLANFWPLRPTGANSTFRAAIDRETSTPLLPYEVLKLYSSHVGDQLVAAKSNNEQVGVLATVGKSRDDVQVFVVNRTGWEQGLDVTADLAGVTDAQGQVLTAATAEAETGVVTNLRVTFGQGKVQCHLPPLSIAVLSLKRR